jgi:DnaK suppressor protein
MGTTAALPPAESVAIFGGDGADMTVGERGGEGALSAEQLATLRERLERLRGELRTRLERDQAVAREAEPEVEPLDAAEQTREQDDAILRANRDRAQLGEVEGALRRMDAGTYGVSEISGEPISFARLRAVPWARYDSDEEPG